MRHLLTGPGESTSDGRVASLRLVPVLLALFLGAMTLTGVLSLVDSASFEPYFGAIPPLLAVAAIVGSGMLALAHLDRRGWLRIREPGAGLRGMVVASLWALLLAGVMASVDALAPLPQGLNVAWPLSLAFYPAIALVAESAFHLLPLLVLVGILSRLAAVGGTGPTRARGRHGVTSSSWPADAGPAPEGVWRREGVLRVALVAAALPEPGFQVSAGFFAESPGWLAAYVGVHVLLINVVQLWLFRRYGFLFALLLRLVYYGLWHVLWGYVRLRLLF